RRPVRAGLRRRRPGVWSGSVAGTLWPHARLWHAVRGAADTAPSRADRRRQARGGFLAVQLGAAAALLDDAEPVSGDQSLARRRHLRHGSRRALLAGPDSGSRGRGGETRKDRKGTFADQQTVSLGAGGSPGLPQLLDDVREQRRIVLLHEMIDP